MRNDLKTYIWVVAAFAAFLLLFEFYFSTIFRWLMGIFNERAVSYGLAYLIVGIPVFVATTFLHRKDFFVSLGLGNGLLTGFLAAFVFTSPMLLGFALLLPFNMEVTMRQLTQGVIYAGFFEELYFRAFFFGLLFRYTRLGFIPSVLAGAVIFGLFHLYQSSDPAMMAGIFFVTLLGAGWFSWVYAEWKFNLWVPVFLHMLMNLYWLLFDAGDNALGSAIPNIFRMLTIAFVILGTLYYKKRKGLGLAVNGRSIWLKTR
jgi:membrane protease YdiL (CAAX protease family)